MSFAEVGRLPAIMRLPLPLRARAFAALALAGLSLVSATGLVATHLFHQPTTLKYVVTVAAPLLLSVACIAKDPLRLLVGAAIVTAPWDLNMTLQGVRVSPVAVLLALAAFVALLEPRTRTHRASANGTVVVLALALLLPGFAIGREQPHYATWILTTLVAGWLALQIARQPGGLLFLLSLLVVAATVQGLIVFYEYARHSNLNLYSAEIDQAVAKSYFFNFASSFRPAGTLPDPDTLGNLLALGCPLALVVALRASSRIVQLAWAACAIVITVALTLTLSRANWLGAGAGVVVALVALPPRVRLRGLIGVGVLLAMTVVIGVGVGGSKLRERFASIEEPTARTVRTAQGDRERRLIWSAALTTASVDPVFGVGMGRLQEHLSEHLGASREGLHAQSVYFQFLAESGVAGLLALLLLLGRSGTGVLAGRRREPMLMAGVGGGAIATLIPWITDTEARYTSVSVTVAFLLGAAMAQHRRSAGPEPSALASVYPSLAEPRLGPDSRHHTSVEALIVSYRTRDLLRQTIATLLAHRPAPSVAELSIAVLDNASDDGSADMVAEEFPAVRLIRSTKNLGFAAANNELARTSNATYVLLLNSDVIVVEDIVTPLLAALQAEPSAVLAGPRLTFPDGSPQHSSEGFPTMRFELARALHKTKAGIAARRLFDTEQVIASARQHSLADSRATRPTSFLWATCWLLAREEIVQHGLFDERYGTYDEDLDFCRRLYQRGRTALFVPGARLIHLGGASSTTLAKEAMMQRGRSRYFRDHSGALDAVIYRLAIAPLQALKRAARRGERRADS